MVGKLTFGKHAFGIKTWIHNEVESISHFQEKNKRYPFSLAAQRVLLSLKLHIMLRSWILILSVDHDNLHKECKFFIYLPSVNM